MRSSAPLRSWSFAAALCLVPVAAAAQSAAPAGAAASNLKLYGILDVYLGRIETTLPTKSRDFFVNGGGMGTSYFGLSGVEDLGGGLRGMFLMESFIRLDVGQPGRFDGDPFWARNAWVGLGGGFGQFQLGRNTTPFFLATVLNNPYGDSFAAGPAPVNVFNANVLGDTGMSNSVRYLSPTLGGLRADVLYSAGRESANPTDRNFGQAVDAALTYAGGPFSAALAMRRVVQGLAGDGQVQKSWQLAGTYAMSWAKLQALYVRSENSWNVLPDAKRRTWSVGATVPAGPGEVLLAYATTKLDDVVASTPNKRTTWAGGYVYPLSRRTSLYAHYFQDKFTEPTGNKTTTIMAGVRHRF